MLQLTKQDLSTVVGGMGLAEGASRVGGAIIGGGLGAWTGYTGRGRAYSRWLQLGVGAANAVGDARSGHGVLSAVDAAAAVASNAGGRGNPIANRVGLIGGLWNGARAGWAAGPRIFGVE